MTHACFPGSFDPLTMGHLDVVERSCSLFDKVTILVTHNPNKKGMFSPEERMQLIRDCTGHLDNVHVDLWSELLVNYTTEHGITTLIKGLRNSSDYNYERPMAQMNRRLSGVDTMFLLTDPQYGFTSSSLVKEVATYGGSVQGLVPDSVEKALLAKVQDR
ncbi:pantetheine-phosphate adenylyltransferase [Corynebacterium sp. TAE3-ERU12]|uniref:pantetheine-phosphate adenylyltransferase n=1 Tax=Corynebacterium sp. TAE3-ERU12 TaxID=2849491 RepID=UPI001C493621|nr:pantetheine-phosphate adenylyltransferase [Corynebacterium sp. TAE3-ERU12]MBV7295196.1 pantetheine-phosphate adenylyltransferase [Corynebacterium sp. TAE3-ERU12]